MQLPEITLPKVELPFDIPVLLHAPIDHFAMALPVVILLLELLNLFLRKRAISGLSFFLIFVTVGVTVAAYFTGLVDGKEAYPALSEAAKETLSEHKTIGTYLMLGTGVLLFFKLLSMIANRGIMKALYLLLLIVYVVGIFEQGKEGGELVYKHGANVAQVKILDDKIFDLEEALEEATEKSEAATQESAPAEPEAVPAPIDSVTEPVEVLPTQTLPESKPVETTIETVDEVVESVKTNVEEEAIKVQRMPEEMVQPQIATH
jgi:uncharacterized membrane protein